MEQTKDKFIQKHHNHNIRDNQLSSYIIKRIKAPVDLVWSLVRRFDHPFAINNDVQGDYLRIGSTRKLTVQPELDSAATITERLDILDEEERVFGVTMIDGDRRMRNCKSIVTVHPEVIDGRPGTLAVESYVVDRWHSIEETCRFVDAFINSYLDSLAHRSENLAAKRKLRVMMKRQVSKTRYVVTELVKFKSVVQELTGMHNTHQSVLYGYQPNSYSKAIENVVEDDKLTKTIEDTFPSIEMHLQNLSPSYQSSLTENSMADDLSKSFTAQDPWHEWKSKPKDFEEIESLYEDTWKNTYKKNIFLAGIERFEFSNEDDSSLTDDRMAEEINLTNGRCSELPKNPGYPFLVKLFLQENNYLTEIPPSFFGYMPNLEVLDMSSTSIKKLPSSISELFKLQELSLRNCKMLMELPPEVRFLKNLKVLDLEGTELICLPKEIMWLLQLELLKFSLYKYANHHEVSSIIPKDTLSKLSYLKELSIDVSPECEWWEAEVEAVITDLGKLENLASLKMYLPTHQLFQKILEIRCIKRLKMDVVMPLLYPTLSNFQFDVGRYEDPIMSCVPHDLQDEFAKLEKCLKFVNLGEYLDPKMLQHVSALFIRRHWSIRTLSEFDLTKMDGLKFCLLAECDWMKAILDGNHLNYVVNNHGGKSTLKSLRYLGIHCMKILIDIWQGPAVKGCFSKLKILAIHTCPNITAIFNHGFLEDLLFLQELIVEDCSEVRSLVSHDYYHSKLNHKNLLPSLRKISLLHLPRLKTISRGHFIASRLEKIVIYNCPKLETLHPLEMCSKYVKEIKGESDWLESNKSGLSKIEHDYLINVFVPLKVDDDDNDDGDEIDELAEAVRVSLTCQDTERNNDLVIDTDIEMKEKLEEHLEDTSVIDEPLSVDSLNSKFLRSNPTKTSMSIYYSCLLADRKPRKNPNFLYTSFACTIAVVSLSNCNLSDDSIPKDLSGLSCLNELDLSFTPVSQLHEGIKWPSGLKFLNFNGCKNLRFLQEFPALLEVLVVNDCESLERINFDSKKLKVESAASVTLLSQGCDKLVYVDSATFRLEPYTNVEGKDCSSSPVLLEPPKSTTIPTSKKRWTLQIWTKQVHASQEVMDDGYLWKKYGQKLILGSSYPRVYYRCVKKGCLAKKQVQRSRENSKSVTITYRGMHTCTKDTDLTPQQNNEAASLTPQSTPPSKEMLPSTKTGVELNVDELDLLDNFTHDTSEFYNRLDLF